MTINDPGLLTYSGDAISFQYPDWPDVPFDEDEVFMVKTNGTEVFSDARFSAPSTMLVDEVEQNMGTVFDGEYAYYVLDPDGAALNAVTRVLYSDYMTYALTIAGPETPDASLLETAECKSRELNTYDRAGIMPIPANGDASQLPAACREARSLGAEVISWYFFWSWLGED